MLFGPDDLCGSRKDIVSVISFLSVRVEKKVSVSVGSVMVFLLNSTEWGTVTVIFLIEIIVLIPFQVFLMLFQLFSKYFV